MEFILQEHSYLFVPTYISSKYLCYDDKDNEEKLVQFEAAPLLQKEFQPIVRCMKNPSLQKHFSTVSKYFEQANELSPF